MTMSVVMVRTCRTSRPGAGRIGRPPKLEIEAVLIFVVNGGSSSVKFALFENTEALPLVLKGSVAGLPRDPHLTISDAAGAPSVDARLDERPTDAEAALRVVLAHLRTRG